jgi:hypothetical protein
MDQHLYFEGRELADDQTLADAGVPPGENILCERLV